MNKAFKIVLGGVIISIILLFFQSCGSDATQGTDDENRPLNVSVYLDLSDRIKVINGQIEKDTVNIIHNIFRQVFPKDMKKKEILVNKSKFNIFFYPSFENIDFRLDLSTTKGKDKEKAYLDYVEKLPGKLDKVYSSALIAGKFPGSDIYGFFEKKMVDKYCIEEGHRNILVILTDGEIYYAPTQRLDANKKTANYILPSTINNGYILTPIDRKIDNLEVLFMEIKGDDNAKMVEIISNWLEGMEIKHYDVLQSDTPSNTALSISKFFKQ